jgi:hypothetical protein
MRRVARRFSVIVCIGMVLLLGTTFRPAEAAAATQCSRSNSCLVTTSTTEHVSLGHVDLPPTDAYQTRVTGILFVFDRRTGLSSTYFTYDAAFSVPPDSAEVTAAFVAATSSVSSTLTGYAQAAGAVVQSASYSLPLLLGSNVSTNTVHRLQTARTQTVTITETEGPATIFIGRDKSQSFFVPAGYVDQNTNTDTTITHTSVTQIVTTHFAWYVIYARAILSSPPPPPCEFPPFC